MAFDLCELWWMFTIKGLISLAFAATCYFFSSFVAVHFLKPVGFLYLLVVFTFYICLIGIILLVGAIYAFDEKLKHRWLLLGDAILNLALGPSFLLTFGFGLRFSMVVALFAVHAMIVGIGYCAMALVRDRTGRKYLLLGLAGAWSLLCGVFLLLYRQAHEERLTVDAALYTAVLGSLLIWMSVRLHTTKSRLRATPVSLA